MSSQQQSAKSMNKLGGYFSVAKLILNLLVLAGVIFVMAFVRPTLIETFDEFETELPLLTEMMLSLNPWLVAAVLIGVGVLLIVKEILIRNPWVNTILNSIAFILILLLVALVLFSLFLPLTELYGAAATP